MKETVQEKKRRLISQQEQAGYLTVTFKSNAGQSTKQIYCKRKEVADKLRSIATEHEKENIRVNEITL